MKRTSKRIDGKVVNGYEVSGQFYTSKKEALVAAGLEKPIRSDKKCVGRDNCIAVADELVESPELALAWAFNHAFKVTDYQAINQYMRLRKGRGAGYKTQAAAAVTIDLVKEATNGKLDARNDERFKARSYKNPKFRDDSELKCQEHEDDPKYTKLCNDIDKLLDKRHAKWLEGNPDSIGPLCVIDEGPVMSIHRPVGLYKRFYIQVSNDKLIFKLYTHSPLGYWPDADEVKSSKRRPTEPVNKWSQLELYNS